MKSGFFCIDKPAGITSHSVVSRMRKILNMKKIGHSGTLDPMATGVMVVGFGTSTRLLDYVQSGTKEYVATISFGEKTNTGDKDGEVTETSDLRSLSLDQLKIAANKFIGDIEQIPPMVSAIKVDGKKLYEYEREGKTIERKPRQVIIDEIEVLNFQVTQENSNPIAVIRIVCSTGTYIRTLAEDIAQVLGGFSHLVALRRTKNGDVLESDCIDLEALSLLENPFDNAIEPLCALGHYPHVELDEEQTIRVSHGKVIELNIEQGDSLKTSKNEIFIAWSKTSPELVAVFPTSNLSDLKSRCVVFLD